MSEKSETSSKDKNKQGSSGSTQGESAFVYFKGLSRLVFYLILGLSIFFGSSIIIFKLRNFSPEPVVMDDLVGKLYTDVHNELSRLQLRVSITVRSYPDLTPGLVLDQSVAPGDLVSPRDKLEVVVNQAEPLLVMPGLVGNTLPEAETTISRLPYKEKVYKLEIGVVSRIASEQAKNTVLAQFPPAEQKISVRDKVFLLVSSGPEKPVKGGQKKKDQDKNSAVELEHLQGQEITMVQEYFQLRGLEYRVTEVKAPQTVSQSGLVYQVKSAGADKYELGVYFKESSTRFRSGYEQLEVELRAGAECVARLQTVNKPLVGSEESENSEAASEADPGKPVFLSRKPVAGEKVKLIFFRPGPGRINVTCGEENIKDESYEADDLT